MEKPDKNKLIRALELTLNEYENDTHRFKTDSCMLCKLVRVNCKNCIMGTLGKYGCLNRMCEPFESETSKNEIDYTQKKKKVVTFFKKLINYFENEKKFDFFFLENNSDFRTSEMIRIDTESYNTLEI